MLRLEGSTGARRTGDEPFSSMTVSISAFTVMAVVR